MEFVTNDDLWFSPINVLYHYARLESLYVDQNLKITRDLRKAREAYLVAIMLLGIIKSQKREYWMQITKDSEGTPDIRTARFLIEKDKTTMLEVQEVEVVELEKHSSDDVVTFLHKTKLSCKKAYPLTTTVLCYISKQTRLPSMKDIYDKLSFLNISNPVIIMGKIHQNRHVYRMCQVNPIIDLLVDFDAVAECYNKKYLGVLRLEKGLGDKLNFVYLENEKHYPFERLNFKS